MYLTSYSLLTYLIIQALLESSRLLLSLKAKALLCVNKTKSIVNLLQIHVLSYLIIPDSGPTLKGMISLSVCHICRQDEMFCICKGTSC